ncbi:MFS transporter [Arthrobacter bussei]|uniref:MFS transporter n=1 Tax=Arthrobacter bussei TaxID=2594179 RepID=A0A7X1NNL1_9MICC|nr:MFS transporter [Arthrobacter bussei]MPY10156.1 MFS transporter [Arthrobacter bussei]
MKRSLYPWFTLSAVTVVAATYGLARLGYGLFLPAFSQTFNLGPALAGILSSGASLLYCGAAVVGFRLAPSNPRLVTALAGATACAGSAGIALAPHVLVFVVAVLVAGMGAGFASPALVELVRRNTEQGRRGRMQSVVNSGTGFGVVVAGLVSLALGDAWRVAWLAFAGIAGASTLAVLRLDRSSPRGAGSGPGRSAPVAASGPSGLWRPLMGSFVFGTGCAALWVYGRSTLEGAGGLDASLSAGAWIALGAGGAGATLLAPWLASRPLSVTWPATTVASAGATLMIGVTPGSVVLACAAAALFGLAYTAATSVLILWASAVADARESGAGGTSLLFIALVLGQAAGAFLTGLLLQVTGPPTAFALSSILCAASATAVVGSRRSARQPSL